MIFFMPVFFGELMDSKIQAAYAGLIILFTGKLILFTECYGLTNSFLYSVGVRLVFFLKKRLKYDAFSKPKFVSNFGNL